MNIGNLGRSGRHLHGAFHVARVRAIYPIYFAHSCQSIILIPIFVHICQTAIPKIFPFHPYDLTPLLTPAEPVLQTTAPVRTTHLTHSQHTCALHALAPTDSSSFTSHPVQQRYDHNWPPESTCSAGATGEFLRPLASNPY